MIDMDTVIAMIETLGERLAEIEKRLDILENAMDDHENFISNEELNRKIENGEIL